MPLNTTAPSEAHPPEAPYWLTALRHFGVALLMVGLIALAVNLLALPVVQAQTRPELRIGHQKSASLFVLQKAQGTLEKKLAPLGFGVKWVEFPAGPQPLEGLNVGAVDVGYVGEAPPYSSAGMVEVARS